MKILITILFTLLISTSTIADFNKGANAYNSGDYRTAFKELLPYANEGNAEAQWALGRMYRLGNGLLVDYSEALKWFKKSGNQGHDQSSAEVANMYYWDTMHGLNGHKVLSDKYNQSNSRNKKLSFKWWEKAAEQGNIIAMFKVGLFYAKGYHIPQNKSEAKKWFNLAYASAPSDLKQTSRTDSTLLEDIEDANRRMEAGYFDGGDVNIRHDWGTGVWY